MCKLLSMVLIFTMLFVLSSSSMTQTVLAATTPVNLTVPYGQSTKITISAPTNATIRGSINVSGVYDGQFGIQIRDPRTGLYDQVFFKNGSNSCEFRPGNLQGSIEVYFFNVTGNGQAATFTGTLTY